MAAVSAAIAGACLKAWPEPSPSSQTLPCSGCRTRRTSPPSIAVSCGSAGLEHDGLARLGADERGVGEGGKPQREVGPGVALVLRDRQAGRRVGIERRPGRVEADLEAEAEEVAAAGGAAAPLTPGGRGRRRPLLADVSKYDRRPAGSPCRERARERGAVSRRRRPRRRGRPRGAARRRATAAPSGVARPRSSSAPAATRAVDERARLPRLPGAGRPAARSSTWSRSSVRRPGRSPRGLRGESRSASIPSASRTPRPAASQVVSPAAASQAMPTSLKSDVPVSRSSSSQSRRESQALLRLVDVRAVREAQDPRARVRGGARVAGLVLLDERHLVTAGGRGSARARPRARPAPTIADLHRAPLHGSAARRGSGRRRARRCRGRARAAAARRRRSPRRAGSGGGRRSRRGGRSGSAARREAARARRAWRRDPRRRGEQRLACRDGAGR